MPDITVEMNAGMSGDAQVKTPPRVWEILAYDAGAYPKEGYVEWSSRTLVFAKPVNLGCAVAQWDGCASVTIDLVPLNEIDDRLYRSSYLPMRKNITRRFVKGRKSNRWRISIKIEGADCDFVLRNVRVASTPLELATV